MPGVNGMVLGRQLKQRCPGLKLVYVSAYLEFALEGYTVNAYRYLLKRDIVHTLPSCLDDLLAELTDQRKTLTVHHNRTAGNAVQKRFFAGEPQRCGQHEICMRHPQL